MGAGLGSLADRPAWKQILASAAESLGDDDRKAVEALIEQGRLRPVLEHLRSKHGAALREGLNDRGDSDAKAPDSLTALAKLPWASVFATVHADLAPQVASTDSGSTELVAPDDLDGRTFGNGAGRLVLHTPADLPSWVGHPDLHDVVQQAAAGNTILLLGFSVQDPDFEMVLDTLGQLGRGSAHYAVIDGATAPEREAIARRFGVEVVEAGDALTDAIEALVKVGSEKESADEGDDHARTGLDLALVVGELPLRADVASVAARDVNAVDVAGYVRDLGASGLPGLGVNTLLRAGAVLLEHADVPAARMCFDAALSAGRTDVDQALARFGCAWVEYADGKSKAAVEGLRKAAELHSAAALVPAGQTVDEIVGRQGSRSSVLVTDADGKRSLLEVTTLPRAVASKERAAFDRAVAALAKADVSQIVGGRAQGRRLVVECEPYEGQTLAEGLAAGVLSLEDTARLMGMVADTLCAAHGADVVHGCVTAENIVLSSSGAVLRGFGPAAALGRVPGAASAAPEIVAGAPPTAKSDGFALATLAFRSMTGAPAGGVPATSISADLDPRVDAVLADGMHPDPAKRSTVETLHKALAQIVSTPDERPDLLAKVSMTVAPPDDANDLDGWKALLKAKPTNSGAKNSIERIENEARSKQQWDRVAEVLSVRADLTQVVAERIAAWRELGRLYENELGVPASAFEATRKLLDIIDANEQGPVIEDLARLAETAGLWAPFADAVTAAAARTTDPEVEATLQTRLGEVLTQRLGAPERAIAAYERAAELAPGAETLGVLIPLYRAGMRMAELATTLLSLADYQEGADKIGSLIGAADLLQTDMGESEGALAALHAVLELEPDHAVALAQAEDLARELEEWESLVDILAQRAQAGDDMERSVEQLREAAQLCLDKLEQTDRAVELLSELLGRDRADKAAAGQLVELLRVRVAEDPLQRVALIDALEIYIEGFETPEKLVPLLAEQALLLEQETDGKARAADARERIIEVLGVHKPEAQEAAQALEKWYRRQQDDDALVRLLERQGASLDAEDASRVDAWAKLLELRVAEPEDAAGATTALEKLVELQPDNAGWRDRLLSRYLDSDDFQKAGPLIRSQVWDENDPKRKAELLLRGGLLRQQIGKTEGAVEALEEAVELDASLHAAWVALFELYTEQDQPLKAIEAQVSGARVNPSRSERAQQTFEAASKFIQNLGQPSRGLKLLEELVEFDPDHRDGTAMLVDRLVAEGDLERAWPHAQTRVMQIHASTPNDKQANIAALSVAGRCALTVGEPKRAREYLEKARTFDATNLKVLRLLADLSIEAGEFAEALRHYQSVVLGVGSKLAPPDLSRLYVHMAEARRGMEEPAKAVQMAERALEIDPDNEEAVEKLSELAEAHGGPEAQAKAKQRNADLLGRKYDAAEEADKPALIERRVVVLRELAKLQSDDLKTPVEAVRTLEVLLEIKSDDPSVLHEILAMFTKNERWRDAANVIARLAAAQSEPAHRLKYLWAGTLIYRDHMEDSAGTMEWIQRVLEIDPLHEKAYTAGVEILEKSGEFKQVARFMRARLKALPKDAPAQARVDLFAGLGRVYEEHLGDLKTAVAAYNQSVRFATAELAGTKEIRERRVRVMKIAVQLGDDEIDKAIMQGHALVADNPMEFEVYHRLVELYLRRGDRDRARAFSRTLLFLRQADEAEQNLAEQNRGAGTVARRKISRELWRKAIVHRGQNNRISDLLGVIWPMVAGREGQTHKQYGVTRGDRVEVSIQSPTPLVRFMAHAQQIFDGPMPDFFMNSEPGGLAVKALVDTSGEQQRVHASVIAGKQAQAERDEAALKFMAARAIARGRPEHILGATLRNAGSLRGALYGLVSVSVPDAAIPSDVQSEAGRLGEIFKTYLSPSKMDQIGKVAGKVLAKGDIDTKQWLEAAGHTVTRAGFVLCDDLQAAAKVLTNEGDAGVAVSAKDRIRDLVGFSVSDGYLSLRREIGLAD